ncbi:MAG: hypothetical protein GY889_15755 [Proteobacteria bacterium]|nr:hypothetical protein [Pseudomonadota bacterium]
MITAQGLQQLGFVAELDFSLRDNGDGNIYLDQWNSASPQPTEAEIEAAHNEWQTEHDSQEYARNRATAYAPLGEQLDMQYHDSVTGSRTWLDHVEEIKARFPK